MRNAFARLSIAAALAAGAAAPGHAQDQEELLEPFRDCGEIADGAARLACFDAALAGADAALASLRSRQRQRTVDDFGLSSVQIEEREDREQRAARRRAGDAADAADAAQEFVAEPDEITAEVVNVIIDRSRSEVYVLDNGQIWREASNRTFNSAVRPGMVTTISRGGIGGFRMRFEGRVGFISVQRMQ